MHLIGVGLVVLLKSRLDVDGAQMIVRASTASKIANVVGVYHQGLLSIGADVVPVILQSQTTPSDFSHLVISWCNPFCR